MRDGSLEVRGEVYMPKRSFESLNAAAEKNGIDLYEHDIVRHMRDNEGIRFTQAVYESIPGQLNKENKRFKYSGLARDGRVHKGDLRFSRMKSSFDWLGAAGVALPTLRLD